MRKSNDRKVENPPRFLWSTLITLGLGKAEFVRVSGAANSTPRHPD